MINSKIKTVYDLIQEHIAIKQMLFDLDVIRSERFIGEFGEWFAENLFGAIRAKSTSQIGWDLIDDNGQKYQVKTHAKGKNNNARWTNWSYSKSDFDVLILLIFSNRLEIKEIYKIPYEIAFKRINLDRKQKVLMWDNYADFKLNLNEMPDHLNVFLPKVV